MEVPASPACHRLQSRLSLHGHPLKVYSTSMAMLLTMIISRFLFNFKPTLQLFLGIIICMMSLHMYFAPPNMRLDMPVTLEPDEERE
ncbi:hypothetical protein PIB30_003777 [Stylosanthes scabra]|uniref:Uncharacterized protein n=1 Tax=Stylosanthes scabra TaxID=79078 RepID=A0ABU6R2G3_9FABA|nr:hypothetical protein [Stylosanthes scabra]